MWRKSRTGECTHALLSLTRCESVSNQHILECWQDHIYYRLILKRSLQPFILLLPKCLLYFEAFRILIQFQKFTRCDPQYKWSFQQEQLIKDFLIVVGEFLRGGRLGGFIACVRTAQYFWDQEELCQFSQEDVLPRVK